MRQKRRIVYILVTLFNGYKQQHRTKNKRRPNLSIFGTNEPKMSVTSLKRILSRNKIFYCTKHVCLYDVCVVEKRLITLRKKCCSLNWTMRELWTTRNLQSFKFLLFKNVRWKIPVLSCEIRFNELNFFFLAMRNFSGNFFFVNAN